MIDEIENFAQKTQMLLITKNYMLLSYIRSNIYACNLIYPVNPFET